MSRNQAATATQETAAPDDMAALALATRALAIATAPTPAPVAPASVGATAALQQALALLAKSGAAIPPQVAATMATLGVPYTPAATNRPDTTGLRLTGPKSKAAAEIAYRTARASGQAAYLPTQYVAFAKGRNPKVPGTAGWFRVELIRCLPRVADYVAAIKGKGATEMAYNLKSGDFVLSDAPLPAVRLPYLESLTDAEIAAMPEAAATWAAVARDAAVKAGAAIAADEAAAEAATAAEGSV